MSISALLDTIHKTVPCWRVVRKDAKVKVYTALIATPTSFYPLVSKEMFSRLWMYITKPKMSPSFHVIIKIGNTDVPLECNARICKLVVPDLFIIQLYHAIYGAYNFTMDPSKEIQPDDSIPPISFDEHTREVFAEDLKGEQVIPIAPGTWWLQRGGRLVIVGLNREKRLCCPYIDFLPHVPNIVSQICQCDQCNWKTHVNSFSATSLHNAISPICPCRVPCQLTKNITTIPVTGYLDLLALLTDDVESVAEISFRAPLDFPTRQLEKIFTLRDSNRANVPLKSENFTMYEMTPFASYVLKTGCTLLQNRLTLAL